VRGDGPAPVSSALTRRIRSSRTSVRSAGELESVKNFYVCRRTRATRRCSFCAVAAAVPPRPEDGTVPVVVLFTA